MKLVTVMSIDGYSVHLEDEEKKKTLLEGTNNASDVLMFCAGFIGASSHYGGGMYFELGKHAAKQHKKS